MGAIQELPTEAGGWTLETRSESFYMGVRGWNAHKFNKAEVPAERLYARRISSDPIHNAFRFPVAELAPVLAVLDFVISHPGFPIDDQQPWRVALSDDGQQLEAEGPVEVYGVGIDWEMCGTIEPVYAGLGDLRTKLGQFTPQNPR